MSLEKNATEYRRASESQRANLRLGREELILGRRRIQNSAAQLRIYVAEQNELRRLAREKERANRASRLFQATLQGVVTDLRFFAVGTAFQGIETFARDMFRVGVETETTRATLRQFTDDVEGTFQRLERESRSLIGIDLSTITHLFSQLRAGGAEAEESITIIRGFSKSLAELGTSSFEVTRFMLQLRQSFAANRIEGDDVKTLIEIMPTFLDRASQSLGVQVESWKDLNDVIEASGKTVRQFYIDLAQQQDLQSTGADLNTFRSQWELFREEIQRVQREISGRLLPTLTNVLRNVRETFFTGTPTLDLRIPLPDVAEADRARIALSRTRTELSAVNTQIAEIESERGDTFSNILEDSKNVVIETIRQRDALSESALAARGLRNSLRDQLKEQITDRNVLQEIQRRQVELTARELALQQQITETRSRRPAGTFDGAVDRPRATFFPQRRPETGPSGRPLSEIGPRVDQSVLQSLGELLDEDLQRLRRVLVPGDDPFAGIRPTIPSISPTDPQPLPDLSEGITDLQQGFEILRIESRDFFNRIQVNARTASIPVFNFANGLKNLGGILERAKVASDALTEAIDAGRQRFAQEAEADVARRERFRSSAAQVGVGIALDLTNLPFENQLLTESRAEQRGQTAQRALQASEDLQRDAQRRIEDIANQRELSERERTERIIEIQASAARRREDIERSYARRIREIDNQLARARADIYFNFVENAIVQLNRLVQQEIQAALVRQLVSVLPGGGLGILALGGISAGLGIAGSLLQRQRTRRDESLAAQQVRRFEGAQRQSIVVQNEIRFDDGTVRRQNDNSARIADEGRTPR